MAADALRLALHGAKASENRGDVFVGKGQYQYAIQGYGEPLPLDPKLGLVFNYHGEQHARA
jgi:hypothetical protein